MRGGIIFICVILVMMNFQTPIEFSSKNSDGPTFPLEVSTDKYYYTVGEIIVISLTNVGDEDVVFRHDPPDLYIVDSALRIVVDNHFCGKWFWEVRVPPGSNYTMNWDQKYKICDINGFLIPPSGLQVDPGKYLISAGMDNASYGNQSMSIWDSVWVEIGPGNESPVADAGPDQIVNVGEVVQFDGSGSYDPDDGWQTTTVDSAGRVGSYTSLALDRNDNPHIGYYDWTNDGLKYAKWNGTAWNIEIVDKHGGRWANSITLDKRGYPHISYYNNYANDEIRYAKWNGSAWIVDSVDSNGFGPSLVLDGNGTPHITYKVGNPDEDLRYARWNGTAWNIETVDSIGSVGGYSSLALGRNDSLHISYQLWFDVNNGYLKYAKWNGTAW
ncbi:MAG: hypothetical protein E3J35_04970, partial [Methanomassiliicoccales archaeon]